MGAGSDAPFSSEPEGFEVCSASAFVFLSASLVFVDLREEPAEAAAEVWVCCSAERSAFPASVSSLETRSPAWSAVSPGLALTETEADVVPATFSRFARRVIAAVCSLTAAVCAVWASTSC
ncbi:hypothetical protein D3C71_1621660 [compost metagenome]